MLLFGDEILHSLMGDIILAYTICLNMRICPSRSKCFILKRDMYFLTYGFL